MGSASDKPTQVLIADSTSDNRGSLVHALASSGISCVEAVDGLCAWSQFRTQRPDLILAALKLPGLNGLELLSRVREVSTIPFVIQVPSGELAAAVSAIRGGAADVIPLPCDISALPDRIRAAIADHPNRSSSGDLPSTFVGRSTAAARVREKITALAGLRIPVLFRGEKGTGRDHAALSLAVADGLQPKDVIRLCPTNSSRGVRHDSGRILYLDEIDQHSRIDQAYWSERIVESEYSLKDAQRRIVASTSCDLEALSRRGEFDPRLANCLGRFTVDIPPLRSRLDDITLLANTLGSRISRRIGRARVAFTAPAVKLLQEQPWPGNIAQLAGVIERLVAFSPDGLITRRAVACVIWESPASIPALRQGALRRQREELVAVLDATGGNLAEAARRLSMSRGAIIYRAQKFGLLPKRT